MDIAKTLQQAITHHQANEFSDAQRLYRDVLLQDAQDPDANHNLGVLLMQNGQLALALPYLHTALEVNPTEAQYWLSYIKALIASNQLDMAKEVLEIGCQSGLQGEVVETISATLSTLMAPLISETVVAQVPSKIKLSEAAYVQQVLSLFHSGQHIAAEHAAVELVGNYPRNAFGWKLLGVLMAQQGRMADAEVTLKKAAKLAPNDAEIHNNLGNVFNGLGKGALAIQSFKQAIRIKYEYAEAHYNLGNVFKDQKKLEESLTCYRRATQFNPQFAEAYGNMGNVLSDLGRYEVAMPAYAQAIKLRPSYAEAYRNLGTAKEILGDLAGALENYEAALKLVPNDVDGWFYRAHVLHMQNQFQLAKDGYLKVIALNPSHADALNNLGTVCVALGCNEEALYYYRQAILNRPEFVQAYNNIGSSLLNQGKGEEAEAAFLQAFNIAPDNVEVLNNLGFYYYRVSCFNEAIQYCNLALEINKQSPEASHHIALARAHMSQWADVLDGFLTALQFRPDYQDAYNNLLFCANYHPDISGEEIYGYYEAYEKRYGEPLRVEWRAHDNDRTSDRRLKIGYVSPAFHKHSVRHFLEPLLAHHDDTHVETYAYAEMSVDDDITKRYQGYVNHWVNTRGMSDAQLADRIRQDRIDILVDLAGHTAHNRLLVFARKPAPVSLHWLDFGYTTGLKAIDYYLTDAPTVPEGSEHLFSETPWRLPVPSIVYRPDADMGDITPLPAEQNGYITFGTLTRSVRINDRVIRVWSEILKRIPTAKLNINSSNFKDPAMQTWMQERFMQQGIDATRLIIGFQSPAWKILQQTDITLDCFPHNSGTTLLESLYMGVPFITLAGRPSVGTLGTSLLHGIGHPEWSADSEEAYIQKAVQLAQNLSLLAQYRASLRTELQNSSLMDEVGFTRAVEQAYQQMWHKWSMSN